MKLIHKDDWNLFLKGEVSLKRILMQYFPEVLKVMNNGYTKFYFDVIIKVIDLNRDDILSKKIDAGLLNNILLTKLEKFESDLKDMEENNISGRMRASGENFSEDIEKMKETERVLKKFIDQISYAHSENFY